MIKTLIIYSTTDGQTVKICNKLAENSFNNNVKLCSLKDIKTEDLSIYNKIIIGASIRYGKHNPLVLEFVRNNLNILNNVKTAFFSVNVVARKKEKNTPSTNPYVKKFIKQTNWKPTNIGVFAGKVDYPSYKFFDKYIIRFIMWLTKGPTDISQSYEFTNWDEVEKFGKKIYEM
mgnify:CR=1 FL=1|tara:strand:+ start:972 stop:1493 length:522 start_codon:yes stop_codon:yes gene_type:complete